MADIKKIKVGNTTYDIRDATAARSNHTHSFDTITNRGEAFLSWGGKNFSGTYGPIDAAMVPELGANRLAFMPANAVTIEYSRDGGSTWTDYGPTDPQKVDLFNGRGSSFTIGKATSGAGNIATNKYQLRVNIYTSAGQVYTALNKFVIYLSTSGTNNNWCTIRARKQSDYTAGNDKWTTFADKISVSGWSGYNVINTSGITTYGNTASTQYGHIQFIFGCDTGSTNNSYPGLQINKIFGFGGVGWTTPSTMAKTGHIYTYDSSQNVTFPAGVSAKSFTENGTSLANKYAAKSHTHNYAASDSAGGPANSVKKALTFGSKTYDGSTAQTITASDLGALTSHQDISGKVNKSGDTMTGDLTPKTTKGASLGTSSLYWNNIYGTTLYENGTSLSNKYLGKTAKAADADKLDGNDSTYYLNYNNLSNKPTIPTVPTALKNPNSITFKAGSETVLSYDGSAAKTFTIDASTTNGAFTISDGTTTKTVQLAGKFTDNNTTYSAGTGLQLSGTTFSAKLNSTTSLGTIGSTSKLYAVGVDANGKLCVNVPWTDTDTDTHNSHAIISGTKSDNSTQIKGSASSGDITLGDSGVTAGTYRSVTVNSKGIVVAGSSTDADTNTWRKVQLDGTDKLGTGTNTNPLNIKAGSNMTITESNGTFTFAATDTNTDTKVTSVDNHYQPTANAEAELTATLSGTAGAYAKDKEYTVLTGVKAQRDAKGHVTGLTYTAQKIKDTNNTYSTATESALGLVKSSEIGAVSNRYYNVQVNLDGTMRVNVPWTDTKNAAGSYNNESKLFLIGTTSQTTTQADSLPTYSYSKVYTWSGNLYANAFYAASDRRLKENIKDLDLNCLDLVNNINLREFSWKADEEHKPVIGAIAQELRQVLPEKYVHEFIGGQETDNEYLSINDSKLIYLLIGAIQEQQKEIESLRAKIDSKIV